MRLGTVSVDPPLILAPMAGITDHLYRLMLRRVGGVGLVTMEFISSEAITRGNARQLAKLFFSEEERPLSIQIYGSDPERMAAAFYRDYLADPAHPYSRHGTDDVILGSTRNDIIRFGVWNIRNLTDDEFNHTDDRKLLGYFRQDLLGRRQRGIRGLHALEQPLCIRP